MQSKGFIEIITMALTVPRPSDHHFGDPQQRLEYLVDMIQQLQSMAAVDYPTVSRHLAAALQEAKRLESLR